MPRPLRPPPVLHPDPQRLRSMRLRGVATALALAWGPLAVTPGALAQAHARCAAGATVTWSALVLRCQQPVIASSMPVPACDSRGMADRVVIGDAQANGAFTVVQGGRDHCNYHARVHGQATISLRTVYPSCPALHELRIDHGSNGRDACVRMVTSYVMPIVSPH